MHTCPRPLALLMSPVSTPNAQHPVPSTRYPAPALTAGAKRRKRETKNRQLETVLYSDRSTCAGSTRAARRACTLTDATATASAATPLPTKTRGEMLTW